MYGIIMLVVKDLVVTKYSQKEWERICDEAKCPYDFVTNERYDDAVVLNLVGAAVKLLNVPQVELIEAIGYWFIIYIKYSSNYGKLLGMMGSTLPEVLNNVNNMHAHLLKVAHFPEITSPTFQITHVKTNSLHLHYTTGDPARGSLFCPLVVGLLKSLGDEMNIPQVNVKQIRFKARGAPTDVFRIRWSNQVAGDGSVGSQIEEDENTEQASASTISQEKLGADGRTLGRLFPFHIIFGKEGVITQTGKSMQRVAGIEAGDNMEAHFTIVQPEPCVGAFNKWKTLLKFSTQDLFRLSHQYDDDTVLLFEGELVFMKSTKSFLYACTPVLKSFEDAQYFGLSLRDFALGDKASKVAMLLANAREQDVQNFHNALAQEREKLTHVEKSKKEKTGLLGALRRNKKKSTTLPSAINPSPTTTRPSSTSASDSEAYAVLPAPVKFDDVDLGQVALFSAGTSPNATVRDHPPEKKAELFSSHGHADQLTPLPSGPKGSHESREAVGSRRSRSPSLEFTKPPLEGKLSEGGSVNMGTVEKRSVSEESGSRTMVAPLMMNRSTIPIPSRQYTAFQEMLLTDSWNGFPVMRHLLLLEEKKDDDQLFSLVLDFYTMASKEELLLRTMLLNEIRSAVGSDSKMDSLFRENSAATKLWVKYVDRVSDEYTSYLVTPLLNDVGRYDEPLEVDERRINKQGKSNTEANARALVEISQNFLNHLIKSVNRCPAGVRRVLIAATQELSRSAPESRMRAVTNLFFLRFLSPLLVSPNFRRKEATQRSLTFVSKILHNLFNNIQFGPKEPFMMPFNTFFSAQNVNAAQEFLEDLLTLRPTGASTAGTIPVSAIPGRDAVAMIAVDDRLSLQRQVAVEGIKQAILENMERIWEKGLEDPKVRAAFKQFFSVSLCGLCG
eukprot:TRINITY_DN10471_c0_g1_i1.p1 TRINITY_DN10471_c0_g1~~TRINITY_DN10471_c0_g1_i1.p1  ORF type:complete len:925 (-),score=149.16 TRINITY_DN10471_c0_g1_i1:62-2758(-)